jgi:uncharacterized membrane protein (DUF2068 family)
MVAILEAAKGAVVVLAGFGLLALIHSNIQLTAERLIGHLHLNPAKHYPRIFLDASAELTGERMWLLAMLAAIYASVRFIEAYGLWCGKRWAGWLAAVSGGIYKPFEIYALSNDFTWMSVSALAANALIVGLMIHALAKHLVSPNSPE